MGFDYFIFYTEASLVCVIILLIILFTDRMNDTKQEKELWFDRATFLFILYFISDACWAAMLSDVVPKIHVFVVLFNYTNYILMSMMAYGVFMFIAVSGKKYAGSKKKNFMCFIPVIVTSLFITAAYIIDPLFWINEKEELNSLYFPIMFSIPSLYLIAGFAVSVRHAYETISKEEKRQYMIMGSVPFGVMAFGMIQVVALNAPTFCFGCTIMWLLFYVQNMQALISVDDLTQLNNRGQINRYLEQIVPDEDNRALIMMLDIDRFKGINDMFGHAEGDKALIIVSNALKTACTQINASVFLGRYGGDEFTIVIRNPGEDMDPEDLVGLLRDTLAEKQKGLHLPYTLGFSIGYDQMAGEHDTVYDCLKRADEKLYMDKKRRVR